MFGPTTTAGKIDAFETRFTRVHGGHFLIAPDGREAWPVSAAEAGEYKALYRRRMLWARWLRRGLLLGPLLLILLTMISFPVPDSLAAILLPLYLLALPIGLILHPVISDLTRRRIERGLEHRITTRLPAAITPALTPLGRFGKQLLLGCVALEIGIIGFRLLLSREGLAEHLRVMYGHPNGHEGVLAQVTGNLAWGLQYAALLAIVLLFVDRRARRRAAARAEAAEAAQRSGH
jgi:hypothetical protein